MGAEAREAGGSEREEGTKEERGWSGKRYVYMSEQDKPQRGAQKPHMEKPIMDEPQEEFIGEEAQPSKDISEVAPEERPGAKR